MNDSTSSSPSSSSFSSIFLRLERNQVRHEGVSNMEYLKNVVLKVS